MNSFLPFGLILLLFSIISIEQTSSASFPNPPQFPLPNASPDEWALFWKLLHNYYAIIARPRFGKRYDSLMSALKPEKTYLEVMDSNLVPTSSSSLENDQGINLDDLFTFDQNDRQRRRRRR